MKFQIIAVLLILASASASATKIDPKFLPSAPEAAEACKGVAEMRAKSALGQYWDNMLAQSRLYSNQEELDLEVNQYRYQVLVSEVEDLYAPVLNKIGSYEYAVTVEATGQDGEYNCKVIGSAEPMP